MASEVTKRDGRTEPYDRGKIESAVRRAFAEVAQAEGTKPPEAEGTKLSEAEGAASQDGVDDATQAPTPTVSPAELEALLSGVESALAEAPDAAAPTVERIQDLVERALMERGHFEVAKAYILYRQRRSDARDTRTAIVALAGTPDLAPTLADIERDFPDPAYSLAALAARASGFVKPDMDGSARLDALTKAAVELTSQEAPRWEYVAGRLLAFSFHRTLAARESALGIASFSEKVRHLADMGLYGTYILTHYTADELDEASRLIDDARDGLLDYPGLDLLLKRYVICDHDREPLESPQEMFLGIALHLAMNEPREARMGWVGRFYDTLSRLEVTMATPTLANARKPFHQMSSCFVDTVPDSLEGIYRSVDNFAQVSKFGGGMGMYLGKVRARGGSIRGFAGAAGGVIRWIRVINDTAVAVDQLGVRQGAVAVYLDAWHRDLPEFLQLRTNNGDDRMKAHDVFPAVCYPDLFWRMAEEDLDQPWYLMCPHDIQLARGYALEDSWGDEWERRYRECVADPRIPKRAVTIKDIVRLVIKSAVETGTPFAFMRDAVNRANPNPQAGMVYCSNLCTEIAQDMSAIESVSREVETSDGDTVVVTRTRPGDFVVCNLASLSLGHIDVDDDAALARTVETAIRALDNVINLNFYALPYAKITNRRFRSIGLGVSGYHHMLATHGIRWESDEHLAFVDDVFERIGRHAVEASAALAAERGSYELFEGSDWATGAYFDKRGYAGPAWDRVRAQAARGMRNAYLLAIAPTSSTSIIAGTTAGVDPVMRRFFLEEKKGAMLPRVAPDLSMATYWYYKPAHLIDQTWSVRAAGVRQRHIDQAQSVNLYITNEYTMRQVLNLYLEAWRDGVKTIYYVRSKSLEVEECESCAS